MVIFAVPEDQFTTKHLEGQEWVDYLSARAWKRPRPVIEEDVIVGAIPKDESYCPIQTRRCHWKNLKEQSQVRFPEPSEYTQYCVQKQAYDLFIRSIIGIVEYDVPAP